MRVRRTQAAIPGMIDQINELAAHWHKQMVAVAGGELNGSTQRVLLDADNTEEALDELWLRLNRERAALQKDWFTDADEVFTQRESMFDTMMHIAPVN